MERDVIVYPSPSEGDVHIAILNMSGENTIRIFDITGKLIYNNVVVINEYYQFTWGTNEVGNGILFTGRKFDK